MHFLDNFLTSGHHFSNDENLQKFRFSLFNSILLIASFFTFLNYFASLLELIIFTDIYKKLLFSYGIINLLILYLLRKNRALYLLAVNISITFALIVFYGALVTAPTDEFRLIWFFIVLFASFVLLGKRYGMFLMLFILSSIFTINFFILDIGYSRLALFTFFNSFFIFAIFSYFFLSKIEKDALEFKLLNDKLKEKVSEEVQQRHKQEQMLLQQCRLASMGEMIDSIAHQWRQPLMNINAILMNMDRAIETKEEPKIYLEEKMDEVITLTTHMSQTIEDFRALLKADKQKVHFFIDKSIDTALELYEESMKEITVHFKHSKKLTFFGYNNEFIQVIIILLSNAIEALNTHKVTSKSIFISISIKDNALLCSVEDNAGGIDQKHLDSIFDPYFTTKKPLGGTGVGLYIAKIIIEQNMHGSLDVKNTKRGAKFTIIVPSV